LYQYANIQGILFDMILFFKKGNNNFKKLKILAKLNYVHLRLLDRISGKDGF